MSNTLYDLGEISGETIFIDGTKIEASANKYTFVWKKAVTKPSEAFTKLADFVAECEQLYDLRIVYGNTIKIKHVKRLRKTVCIKRSGTGSVCSWNWEKKTPLQKVLRL